MRFKGLDLNLLFALRVLLEERSVSRAAERMNVSQPAMSSALMRMREYFSDELLVQVGRRMVPTAYAESLHPLVVQVLEKADEVIATSSGFEPSTSSRCFHVSASDYMATVLIGPLMRRLGSIAPKVRMDVYPTGSDATAGLERGNLDLIVTPAQYIAPAHPSEPLLVDRHVVVGWASNPAMAAPLDRDTFFSLGHVAVRFGNARESSFAEEQLSPLLERLPVELTTNSFSSVPGLVVGTMRIAVLQERLANAFVGLLPIRIQPVPLEIPPLREMVQFHAARAKDPGIMWIVKQMHVVLKGTDGLSDGP